MPITGSSNIPTLQPITQSTNARGRSLYLRSTPQHIRYDDFQVDDYVNLLTTRLPGNFFTPDYILKKEPPHSTSFLVKLQESDNQIQIRSTFNNNAMLEKIMSALPPSFWDHHEFSISTHNLPSYSSIISGSKIYTLTVSQKDS